MVITTGKIAWIAIVWAFYLSIGSVGLTLPFVLLAVGTILYLIS